MKTDYNTSHHWVACPRKCLCVKGGGGWSQSIQRAATSQTDWLIYCICWARPACLSGLKNLCLIKPVPLRDLFPTESLEAATYGKLGHISKNEWLGSVVCVCKIFQDNGNNVMHGRTNIKYLGESCSLRSSLNLASNQLIECESYQVSYQTILHKLLGKEENAVKSSQTRAITCTICTKQYTFNLLQLIQKYVWATISAE